MQAKHPIRGTRRILNKERDLLDQKWLTYLLTFILILLVVVFVLAVTNQAWMVQQAKWIVKQAKLGLGLE
jgi:t-SNARE complex subunit (syntaxin)